jgi:hypothetical protein
VTAASVVSLLRARPGVVRLAPPGAPTVTVRVQLAEAWDAVRVEAAPGEPVLAVKVRALAALDPGADYHDDFVVKLRGAEVLDENASLAEVGATDGSTVLLMRRRRRPVR